MQKTLKDHLAALGQITTAQAADLGIGRHTLSRLTRSGLLYRLQRGTYVAAEIWRNADSAERYVMRCRVAAAARPQLALSHTSAVAAHELPLYGVELSTIHLSRIGTQGQCGRQASTVVHPPLPPEAAATVNGMLTCHAAIAVLQVADWYGLESAMVAAERGLHTGLFTKAQLVAALDRVRLGRGRGVARLVTQLASPLSESPGETLTKLLLRAIDLPPPEQQVRVPLPDGRTPRVDFLFREWGVVVEFDGAVKYVGEGGTGQLIREKLREDDLRGLGLEFVRLVWAHLQQPAEVREKILAARWRAERLQVRAS